VPLGGGARTDIGYRELMAAPVPSFWEPGRLHCDGLLWQSATVMLEVNRIDTGIAIVNTVSVPSSTFDIDMADNEVAVVID
jgi:hypothetical protein